MRDSVRTSRNFSPALKVRSITLPSEERRSFVRTKAPPLPGLTCWNSTILKIVPSTSMWLPFLNWLVLIRANQSFQSQKSRCGCRSGACRGPVAWNRTSAEHHRRIARAGPPPSAATCPAGASTLSGRPGQPDVFDGDPATQRRARRTQARPLEGLSLRGGAGAVAGATRPADLPPVRFKFGSVGVLAPSERAPPAAFDDRQDVCEGIGRHRGRIALAASRREDRDQERDGHRLASRDPTAGRGQAARDPGRAASNAPAGACGSERETQAQALTIWAPTIFRLPLMLVGSGSPKTSLAVWISSTSVPAGSPSSGGLTSGSPSPR